MTDMIKAEGRMCGCKHSHTMIRSNELTKSFSCYFAVRSVKSAFAGIDAALERAAMTLGDRYFDVLRKWGIHFANHVIRLIDDKLVSLSSYCGYCGLDYPRTLREFDN